MILGEDETKEIAEVKGRIIMYCQNSYGLFYFLSILLLFEG